MESLIIIAVEISHKFWKPGQKKRKDNSKPIRKKKNNYFWFLSVFPFFSPIFGFISLINGAYICWDLKRRKDIFFWEKILFLVLVRWQKCIMFNRRRFCISTKQQTFWYQISQFQTYQIFILLFLILKTFEIIFKILDLTKWQAPNLFMSIVI